MLSPAPRPFASSILTLRPSSGVFETMEGGSSGGGGSCDIKGGGDGEGIGEDGGEGGGEGSGARTAPCLQLDSPDARRACAAGQAANALSLPTLEIAPSMLLDAPDARRACAASGWP